jgi:ABC-type lipoprotein export system ATPase subunit
VCGGVPWVVGFGCSTVLSGTGVSGVSGGERRRVAIAMELVIDPQVCWAHLHVDCYR